MASSNMESVKHYSSNTMQLFFYFLHVDAEIFKQDKRYGSLGIGSSWRSRQPPRQYPGRRNGPRKGIAGTPESLQDIILRYNGKM